MRRRVALLVPILLLASACSGASDPVEVDPGLVPFDVARSPSPSPQVPDRTITVYLVRDGRLVAMPRTVAVDAPGPEAAVSALLRGPTTEERAGGLSTSVPPATQLLGVTVLDTVAEIDLTDEFQGPAPPEEVLLRVAQVVWTLVSVSGVTSVRFSIDGDPIPVPTDHEVAVDRPVTAPDYASVAPSPDVSGP